MTRIKAHLVPALPKLTDLRLFLDPGEKMVLHQISNFLRAALTLSTFVLQFAAPIVGDGQVVRPDAHRLQALAVDWWFDLRGKASFNRVLINAVYRSVSIEIWGCLGVALVFSFLLFGSWFRIQGGLYGYHNLLFGSLHLPCLQY